VLITDRLLAFSILLACGAAVVPACGSSAGPQSPHKVHVLVLARSSSVRTSQSNLDVYLVEIQPKHGNSFYGKVVDDFPAYEGSLTPQPMGTGVPFTVELRRDSFCDLSADFMGIDKHLNAAELIATRSEGGAEARKAEPEMLRCFSAAHGTWKYEGPRTDGDWWR
jgi:hypothetical protein